MAYAQWIIVTIVNFLKSGKDIKVKNADISWGKFWDGENMDDEISASTVNEIVVARGQVEQVQACGRSDAASGTEGTFDIYDCNNKRICHVSWDCPWGSKSNSFEVEVDDEAKYKVIKPSFVVRSGAIGTMQIFIMDN
ncbi:hypothetical protein DCS_05718 [Drechmeria coniospora]|uniref:Aegerolysin family protein n=1 Tax=Drechmeria coniospora TaxID=98403 RepID=A0A151GNT4_DRECN|nr:hypothetical protein DCS_05718 [Drechmeria coniospora]KYK58701.1 hypothetical protein DCS_05718 [Drechmeria coniospora]